MSWYPVFTSFLFCALLSSCGTSPPYRTQLLDVTSSPDCPPSRAHVLPDCRNVTPEVARDNYELHFVEFDDQGWNYRTAADAATDNHGRAFRYSQTDHLMARLRQLLDSDKEGAEKQDLNIILYVHGWNHHSDTNDDDVKQFRKLLSLQSRAEQSIATRSASKKPRKVVGIYVGWEGKHVELPSWALVSTFWTRKAAAQRVSRGSVLELFSRLQSIQQHYNGPSESPYCRANVDIKRNTEQCRIRSLMVGHSFGAWILYSALAGPLIETLSAKQDVPDTTGNEKNSSWLRRPADLVVLINPAFEAVRYEPLHRTAMAYRPSVAQPPLLVTVTSSADSLTRYLFPAGRTVNTFFQLLERASSEDQSTAMSHTHGHIPRLITHRLVEKVGTCPAWTAPERMTESNDAAVRPIIDRNTQIEQNKASEFYKNWTENGLLKNGWVREFCGDTQLEQLTASSHENIEPNSPIWNIVTGPEIINGHSDVTQAIFLNFIHQLYDDTILNTGNR